MYLARSSPTVLTGFMDASSRGLQRPHSGTPRPPGASTPSQLCTRLASGGMADTINAPEWALPKALAKLRDRPLPPEIQTRALYLGVAVVFISVILTAVQLLYATPPQLVQRISQ